MKRYSNKICKYTQTSVWYGDEEGKWVKYEDVIDAVYDLLDDCAIADKFEIREDEDVKDYIGRLLKEEY